MNKQPHIIVVFLLAFAFFSTSSAEAHRDGCHAAHSCPSDTGSYVCADLGNSSQCGDTPQTNAAPTLTSAPIKQFVAPVATKVPRRQPTKMPTIDPTQNPTDTPVPQAKVVPTAAVAGETSSSSAAGGLITLGMLAGLGYLGHKKFKVKKSSI